MWCQKIITRVSRLNLISTRLKSPSSKCCVDDCITARLSGRHRIQRLAPVSSYTSHTVSGSTRQYKHERVKDRWYRASIITLLTWASISLTSFIFWKHPVAKCEDKEVEDEDDEDDDDDEEEEEEEYEEEEIDLSGLPDIPSNVPYLVIGGGTTAINGVAGLWNGGDLRAKVLIVSEEDYPPYERPPLSREFWFDEHENFKNFKYPTWRNVIYGEKPKTIFHMPEKFYCSPKELPVKKYGGVALLRGRKVVKLDIDNKKAFLDNGVEVSYDKCLIATGGKPYIPEVFENAEEGVKRRTTVFRTLKDFQNLMKLTRTSGSVAVIGGGATASELTCGLGNQGRKAGLKVYQIFPEKGNLGDILPEYISELATKVIKDEGVNVIPQQAVVSATLVNNQVQLGLRDGTYIRVDHVVLAAGLEPNTDLAVASNLPIDMVHKGYLVNDRLQVGGNVDIWVAGGAASYPDIKLGRRCVNQHHHSVLSGRQAGENMAGRNQPYKQMPKFISDLGMSVSVEAVGELDPTLPTTTIFSKSSDQGSTSSEQGKVEDEDSDPSERYGKAVVFYKRNNAVVGVLLWNIYDGGDYAKRLIMMDASDDCKLQEAAKMFNIH